MPRILNILEFWIWKNPENGEVLNMLALHNVLNILEYALTEV